MLNRLFTISAPGDRLERHRHVKPYAAVVLQGGYLEAGDSGRFNVEAGHVILHSACEAHQNAFTSQGAVVLILPTDCEAGGLARVPDPDLIVRLAERDPPAACSVLMESLVMESSCCNDWPDELSQRIIRDPDVVLSEWAEQFGLTPQSLSRGFSRAFGVTPKRFRADQRALRALRALREWRGTGASLAVELGFFDQAHMSKSVRTLAVKRPGDLWWNASNRDAVQLANPS
jgi:AraC-like DNA-binding protein